MKEAQGTASERSRDDVRRRLMAPSRWGIAEILFWVAAAASLVFLPTQHLILAEIVCLALFALSLDLLLGYAGIVSLGHGVFFGVGGYTAALLAKNNIVSEPVLALVVAGCVAAMLGFLTSFLVLRGTDLTRIMVTLGVALLIKEVANRLEWLTGGADGLNFNIGPILGHFEFDLAGHTGYAYSLTVLFVLFLLARRMVHSPFGKSLQALKENPLRAGAVGIPVERRLIAVYTIAAAYAGIAGALLAQTTAFASLALLDFERSADVLLVLILGGTGYLYGGLIGAAIFKLMQDRISNLTPQYWQFWMGLILVLIVVLGRERLVNLTAVVRHPIAALCRSLRLPARAVAPKALPAVEEVENVRRP